MAVNIGVGAINSICWFIWAYKMRENNSQAAKQAALAVFLLNISILLEGIGKILVFLNHVFYTSFL